MRKKNNFIKKSILKFFLLFAFAAALNAQGKYFFEKMSVSDGLSNSVVLCTYQDHLGYLWIGTVDGLDRYDGYDIKVYKNIPNDSTSIPSNIINSIREDKDGNLYIGTTDIVSRYNRASDTFTNITLEQGPQINPVNVNNILCDSKNRLWIATDYVGVQLYDKKKNKFVGINYRDYSGNIISFSSSGFVLNLTELKNGNILTADDTYGVFIYDASKNEFIPYFANPKLDLKGIGPIFEDNSGKLWFAGKADIYIYNPVTYEIKPLDIADKFPSQNRNIHYSEIYAENNKQILIGSDFGILESNLDGSNISLVTENIPGLSPLNFYRDNFGIYWISTGGLGLVKFDPAKKPFQFYKINTIEKTGSAINSVIDVVHDPINKSKLLVANSTRDLFRFDNNTGSFSKMQSLISNETSYNLLPDQNGNLWYTDNDCLKKLDLRTGGIESFPFKNTEYSRGHFNVHRLKFGPDKKIWIANRQGIQIFDPQNKSFDRLPSIMNKSVPPSIISDIRNIVNSGKPIASIIKVGEGKAIVKEFSLDKPAKILIVNLGEGRQSGLLTTMFDYGKLEDSNGKKLWAADTIQNTFYAGGGFKSRIAFGCLDLPKGKYKISFFTDIGYNYGNFNVTAPPDSEWYGIQVLPLNDQQFSSLNPKIKSALDNTKIPPYEIVLDLEFSRKYVNTVWLGANGVGLIKLNVSDNTYKQYRFDDGTTNFPLINQINRILEDKDGIVWLATIVGLIRFDPESEKFSLVTRNDGLVSNFIVFMKEDYNGNIWFGTTGGISMLNKNVSGNQLNFVNYDNTDGLHDMPLNNSINMSDDGEIFYGGYGGLNAFYPGSSNNSLPIPVITSLKISGVPIEKFASDLNIEKDISEMPAITLPFSDNNLSFEFASIHYSRPAKNKLAFMLDGIDKEWNYTNRRFASYLNLSPGEYTFRLKGSNGDGIWNPKETSLKIIINPPWYRTTVAYTGYFVLFVGFIFGIDRIQRKRLLSRERASATLKEAELRAQIAEAESARKTQELEEARNLQLSMLPKELPQLPHLDIAVYMKTATEVGGDYYDFHVHTDGTLTVILGDATGHGMMSGMMVSIMKSLFMSDRTNKELKPFFENASAAIKDMRLGRLMMALTCVQINNNRLITTNAGMPPLIIHRKNQQTVEEITINNMPLGAMKKVDYEVRELLIERGDTLLMMSDGFPELKNREGDLYGYRRARNSFEEIAKKEPEEIVKYLNEEGLRWTENKELEDDVTFVVIKIK